jgi:hypothetical protein
MTCGLHRNFELACANSQGKSEYPCRVRMVHRLLHLPRPSDSVLLSRRSIYRLVFSVACVYFFKFLDIRSYV